VERLRKTTINLSQYIACFQIMVSGKRFPDNAVIRSKVKRRNQIRA
jgi:hypothetical protein